jgi:hypothetical protein
LYRYDSSKKETEIREALLEAQYPENRVDTGFAPVGVDESYRVIISEDPILKPGNPNVPFLYPQLLKNPAMLNAYNYVNNNPLLSIDPSGTMSCREECFLKWDTICHVTHFFACHVACHFLPPPANIACMLTCDFVIGGANCMLLTNIICSNACDDNKCHGATGSW